MVKFFSVILAVATAQDLAQLLANVEIRKTLDQAKIKVLTPAWINQYDVQYVQLQRAWVRQAEIKFDEKGYLPESIIEGLKELATSQEISSQFDSEFDGNDRVNNLHCQDGNCTVPFGLDKIWNYGCWCHFGDNLMEGHGPPVNIFDSICKDFQRCLRCARYDGHQENFECNPIVQTYTTGGGPDFISQCTEGNPDNQCAVYVCSCEQTIIAEIMELAFLPHNPQNEYTDVYLHSNGWSYDDNCPTVSTNPAMGKDCCGYYPKRFPYSLGNPGKACCGNSTLYNPNHQDCCNDNSVVDIGSCM